MSAVLEDMGIGRSILIVDDEPGQRESLTQMILLYGYQVETAAGGEAAITMLQKYTFDLLLLDLNMSGVSGYDVIDYVTQNSVPSKVIVVSGDASFESAKDALRKGAHDFVRKPYSPEELLNTIHNTVSNKDLEDLNENIKQKLSESEYLHRFIVDNSPDIVFMLDTDGRFTFLNDTVHQSLGYEKGELIGEHYSLLVSGQSKDQAKYVFTERRAGNRNSRNVELKLKCAGESGYRYFDTTSMSVVLSQAAKSNPSGFQGTFGVARDVTDKKHAQEIVNFQAYHDLLTKLPNRALMEDRLQIAITQSKRNKQKLAVMFLDLDRFKWVNDTMGHAVGDRLLQAVCQRVEGCLRSGDTLARFGGDEFALVLPQVKRQEDAVIIVNKILTEFKKPFIIDENELYISASIGIAMYPDAGTNMQALIQSADLAMYCVKERGKNGYEFFNDDMNITSNTRLIIERDLRKALANDELSVFYQVQVNAATEEIVGFEALVRWAHPANGLTLPNEFIPIAEETGLILDVGDFVLDRVCADLVMWRKAGNESLHVAVNFSALQVNQDDFVDRIVNTLVKYELPSHCIEVEITENIIMSDMSMVTQKLNKLTSLGIKIAIDDFGTGYSSLSYLQHFPVDTLKIDKSFVNSIGVSKGGTSIVDAIVAMAQGLNLSLIAEGVETTEQLDYLKDLGCTQIQGWLFGKAKSAEMTEQALLNVSKGGSVRSSLEIA